MKTFFETFKKCLYQFDKMWHLICGFAIAFYPALKAYQHWGIHWAAWVGFFLAFWAGVGKEFVDMARGTEFNWWDLLFTTLGGLLATGTLYLAHFAFV